MGYSSEHLFPSVRRVTNSFRNGTRLQHFGVENQTISKLTEKEYFFIGFFLLTIGLLSLFLNVFSLIIYVKHPRCFISHENCPRFVLAVSNTVLGGFYIVLGSAVSVFQQDFEMISGRVGCQIVASLMTFLVLLEVNLSAHISSQQFGSMSRALERTGSSPITDLHKSGRISAIVVLYALLWATAPLFGYGKYEMTPNSIECSIDWLRPNILYSSYVTALFICCFMLPLVFSVYHYCLAIQRLHSPTSNPNRRLVSVKQHPGKYACGLLIGVFLPWGCQSVFYLFPLVTQNPRSIGKSLVLIPYVMTKSINLFQAAFYLFGDPKVRNRLAVMLGTKEMLSGEDVVGGDGNGNGGDGNGTNCGYDVNGGIRGGLDVVFESRHEYKRNHNSPPSTSTCHHDHHGRQYGDDADMMSTDYEDGDSQTESVIKMTSQNEMATGTADRFCRNNNNNQSVGAFSEPPAAHHRQHQRGVSRSSSSHIAVSSKSSITHGYRDEEMLRQKRAKFASARGGTHFPRGGGGRRAKSFDSQVCLSATSRTGEALSRSLETTTLIAGAGINKKFKDARKSSVSMIAERIIWNL